MASAARRQVALIRGINVGRAKRVAMADLRVLMTELGYREVRTVLNSGNVVFTSPPGRGADAAARIEKGLVRRLGISARVMVLTAAELDVVIAENPLTKIAQNPSCLMVFVLGDPADRARLKPLTEQAWAPEALAVGRRVAYLWCPEGIIASRLAGAVGRVLGDAVTARNWATMNKLHILMGPPAGGHAG